MFCPNCGNEIQEGAKFCAKCGSQIGNENVSAMQRPQSVPKTEKKDYKRIMLIVVILACVILLLVLVINKIRNSGTSQDSYDRSMSTNEKPSSQNNKGGFKSAEEVINGLFAAAYDKDVEAVVACYPEEMRSHAIQVYNDFRSGDYSLENNFFNFINLNTENEYQYEIRDIVDIESNPDQKQPECPVTKQSLKDEYGLDAEELYQVSVVSTGRWYQEMTNGYVTDGSKVFMEVAKIGGSWYLVRCNDSWISDWCK